MRPLHLAFAFAAGAASIIAFACSSTTTNTISGAKADSGTGDDGAGDDTTSSDSGGADSSADAGLESVIVTSGLAGQSCTTICAAQSYTCAPACTFGNTTSSGKIAGQVTYSNTSGAGSSGSGVTSYDYEPLKTCDVAPTASEQYDFDTYTLDTSEGDAIHCCCQTKAHVLTKGDIKAPKSCNDVCSAAGLTCDPKAQWSTGDLGGIEMIFACSDSTILLHADCTSPPESSTSSEGASCPLSEFTCACR